MTMTMTRFKAAINEIWYASGQAQVLLFGLWTIVVSGLYQLEGEWALLAITWKFVGFITASSILWGCTKTKQRLIIACVFNSLLVGAVFTTKAVMIGDQDVLRGTTQSHYFVIILFVFWGFYLANLMSRQMLERRYKNG